MIVLSPPCARNIGTSCVVDALRCTMGTVWRLLRRSSHGSTTRTANRQPSAPSHYIVAHLPQTNGKGRPFPIWGLLRGASPLTPTRCQDGPIRVHLVNIEPLPRSPHPHAKQMRPFRIHSADPQFCGHPHFGAYWGGMQPMFPEGGRGQPFHSPPHCHTLFAVIHPAIEEHRSAGGPHECQLSFLG